MKKICLHVCMLFMLHSLFGQADLVLNKAEYGNVIREAENSITLNPGFLYDAVQGETFIARISTSQNEGNNNLPNYNIAVNNIDQQPDFYGSISGSLDVNALGGAMYTIPIGVSPGTAGMQPNLAIVYNSQNGNGVLGLGWGLSGISAISRVSKNTYYDNTIAEITYSATPYDDALALDGNRLVRLSDGTFMTRSETFAKITLSGSGATAWFKVEHKNGQTFEYGNTSDSRLYASGKTNPIAWRLNKVTDSNGNYMQYSYSTVNNESVLEKITYTGNSKTSLAPYNTIGFYYKSRQDTLSKYIAGGTVKQNNILTSIKIECEGVTVKEIILDYLESAIFSKLSKITEKFDENTSSSLSVNWGTFMEKQTVKITQYNIKDIPSDQIFTGDFDGDGIDDILTYSNGKWKLSKGGNETPVDITLTNQPEELDVKKTKIGDFNGDGKKDLILLGSSSCSIYHFNKGTFSFIQSIPSTMVPHQVLIGHFTDTSKDQMLIRFHIPMPDKYSLLSLSSNGTYSRTNLNSNILGSKLFPMNVNGDEFTDLGALGVKKLHIYVMQGNDFTRVDTLEFPTEDIFIEDMNGDGLSDIINITSDTNYDIYYGQGDGNYIKKSRINHLLPNYYGASGYNYELQSNGQCTNIKITSINCCHKQYMVKDFNGDGKADILEIVNVYKPSNAIFNDVSRFYAGLSEECFFPGRWLNNPFCCTGFSSFDPSAPFHVDKLLNSSDCQDEYLRASKEYKRTHFYLRLTGGNTIFWEFSHNDDIAAFETMGDFNGDGLPDFLCKARNAIYSFCDATNSSDFLVKSITNNDLRESTNINYTYASNKSVHTQGTGSSFPYNDFAGPMPVVSLVEIPNAVLPVENPNLGGKSKTEYTYSGLTLHKEGRGMLGFKSITVKNITQGIQNTTYYNETGSTLKSWMPYYSITATTDGTKISSTGKKYAYKTPVSGRSFGYDYIETDTVRNYLTDRYYYTTFGYDNYGNITSSNTTYSQNGVSQQITNTYVTKGAWCLSKLDSIIYKQIYNNNVYTKTTKYTYDALGNLLTATDYPGKPKSLTTTYVPNTYGLPTTITLSAPGQTSRVDSLKYDAKFRFLAEKKNKLGQTVKMKYDARTGNVLEEENMTTGLKTEMKYDTIGRLKKVILPDGITTQVYIKKPDANVPNAKYYMSNISSSFTF